MELSWKGTPVIECLMDFVVNVAVDKTNSDAGLNDG